MRNVGGRGRNFACSRETDDGRDISVFKRTQNQTNGAQLPRCSHATVLKIRKISKRINFLIEANFDVGTFIEGYGVDETHLPLLQRDDQRLRANTFAEKPHAAQEIPVSDARARED